MQVTIRLFASFRVGRFVEETRDLPPDASVADVVRALEIPAEAIGMIMLDRRHAPLEQRLHDGARLALFPLLGGG
ncbi:MoaD/ThiS family protein [Azospirillum sp.]|uniref:MoaD/ThiS family protein n=1 Tax=Azospirillum sp. TaxID=34012 RepID=UPI002D2B2CB5|nr:MoaD/ThiS family protein [Azospirillum sp.]HYD65446.1 MoaD/ThiS family protein [Azospirillum sp.]